MAYNCSILPSFEKLQNESNYAIWKFQMELYLTHDGLWKYTKETPENDEFEMQQDQKARAKIGLMVEKECIYHLKQTNNAREAWKALRNAYENGELNNSGQLLAKLVSLKLDQFKTMKQYITEVMQTAQQLKDIGKEVDDELLATILLQGLSEKYATFRIAIENSNNTLTSKYVRNKLLGLGDLAKTKSKGDDSNNNKEAKRKRKAKGKQERCRVCQANHAYRDCPDLSLAVPPIEKQTENKPKRKCKTSTSDEKSNKDWVMDSGDYAHMTNRKDYPCFLMVARVTVCCLVKFFKLW